jgi:phosphoinositide-3-kinase regulatory subunit 4
MPAAAANLQDVFSLGCVIAELWLDGRAFFDLSRLLAYRRGEYDPSQALTGVAPDIAELIMHMIQRAPGAGLTCKKITKKFLKLFSFFHFKQILVF